MCRSPLAEGIFKQLLKERIENDRWKMITYSDLNNYYEKNKQKPDLANFEKMARTPRLKEENQQQQTIGKYL